VRNYSVSQTCRMISHIAYLLWQAISDKSLLMHR